MLYPLKLKVCLWLFRVVISAQLSLLRPVIKDTLSSSHLTVQVFLCLAVPQPFVTFN